MRRVIFLLLVLLMASVLLAQGAGAAGSDVYVLTVDGTINPPVAGYIDRGITLAEDRGASVLIVELSTPGGLLSSTQDIVERILEARVPVVVYVNRWAGSAGAFITIAAHVASMAPASRIGASTPVSLEGEMTEEMQRKITEDTAAWMRSVAEARGRNVEAAEATVREAASYTDVQALELNLIDLRADSLSSLISQLDGMEVTLDNGERVIIDIQDPTPVYINMNAMEHLLSTIADPNIAYILFTIGMLGLIIELSNPGSIFPGVVGAISMLLALYSLGTLDAYWGGVLLLVLAFVFFIAELLVTSHGLLTLGGVASLVMGSLILFSGNPLLPPINKGLIVGMVSVVTICIVLVIWAVVRAHRRRATTGYEGLLGRVAVAQTPLDPEGMVFIEGERWKAIAEGGKVEPGEEVIITKVEGLKVWVTKSK